MMLSGGALVTIDQLVGRYENSVNKADLFGDQAHAAQGPRQRTITGPVNVLLVGIDPRHRDPFWIPRADTVLIMHVPAGMNRAYLFSLPRDLLVAIPPFPQAGYVGSLGDKLAHAMFFGSRVPGDRRPNIAQGFELLANTVSAYTGIQRFDAGAIIDFSGFRHVIDALGGIDMQVDQLVSSIHRQPDGSRRPLGRGKKGYIGPQMTYLPGRRHFNGWQALDYARQRYTAGGDYARQRHQQQLVRAMMAKAFSADLIHDPLKLDRVLRAAGKSLTFSGRGYTVLDWAFSLRGLRAEEMIMIRLAGGGIGTGKGKKYKYQGEQLDYAAKGFLQALVGGSVDAYVVEHPEMVNTSH